MALSFRLCFLLVTLVSGVAGGPLVPRGVTLNSCSVPRANERQVFVIGSTIQLATQTADGFTLCVTAANGSPGILTALPCNMSTSGQGFSFAAGIITSTIVGNPIVAAPAPQGGPYYVGQPFSVLPSSAANGTEQFVLNTTGYPAGSGVFVHTASGMCLDAGPLPNAHACLDPAIRYTQSFCDPSLPIPDRVGALISRLTLAEKISLTGVGNFSNYADACDCNMAGIDRLSVPSLEWLVETNAIVASACYGNSCATAFPSGMNLAATFNSTLWRIKGQVISTEMRAFNNLAWHRNDGQTGTHVGLNGFGPDINQPRDPRNGRAGELVSEDPFLTGEYAVQMVQGMQQGDDPRYLKMFSGVKHYLGYSMETNRFSAYGNFSTYDLWDTYLRPYEPAFTRGNAAGSMCSYVSLRIDGAPLVPMCASEYLLSKVVRGYWGRSDVVHTSDCGAVENMANGNHYVSNYTEAAAVSINAGLDVNIGKVLPLYLGPAIAAGYTTEQAVDEVLNRTFALRMRLGMFDPLETQPYVNEYGPEDIGSPAHRAAAMEATAQGLVLVKNAGPVLPLKAGSNIAVVGPLGLAQSALLGDYYGDAYCPGGNGTKPLPSFCVPTIAAAIAAVNSGGSTVAFTGTGISTNDSSWGPALSAAASADVVILALGGDLSLAKEGSDLQDIGLPAVQAAFGAAVLQAAAGKPVILLLVSPFPTSFDNLADGVNVIVLAYSPGFGAPAIANALFGANRWGRAVMTQYPAAYQNAVALTDFSMVPGPNNPGRTYRYYNGSVGALLVTFGHGLSYSSLSVKCSGGSAGGQSSISVNCSVASVSGPDGDQVLLVFHRVSADVLAVIDGQHPVPLSTLVGFTRFSIPAGNTVPVSFDLSYSDALSLVDATGASVVYPGTHYLDVFDGSANNMTIPITVPGNTARVVKRPPLPT